MCLPTNISAKSRRQLGEEGSSEIKKISNGSHAKESASSFYSIAWPVHPLCIVAIAPFLPTWLWLSRGYTVWYHLITITYLLTQKEPLRRFLIVQGTGISLGWYTVFFKDYYVNGRFAHILYMNMPKVMKAAMVNEEGHVFYTNNSMGYMAISHVFDTLLHPGIVYILLKAHWSSGGTIKDICTWKVIMSAFAVSRLWSLVHTYYHDGVPALFYAGYDVYHIHDLGCWVPAYIAESMFLVSAALYKFLL